MIVAASIACVFLISAMNVFVLSGKFFKIADLQALKTERSIIYYETFTKMASKRFMPKQYFKPMLPPKAKLAFQAIDVPKFARLKSPNGWAPSEIELSLISEADPEVNSEVNDGMFIAGFDIWYGRDVDPMTNIPLSIVLSSIRKFFFERKNVYFKPVYVNKYKHRQDKGSGWDKGDFLPFNQTTFDELIREKEKGNVSRIYLVVK
jgi:hypothetical protein